MNTCIRILNTPGHEAGVQSGVALIQNGPDKFTVTYGLSVKKNLRYEQAAKEFGACVMHALACDGLLDNSDPGEF